MNRAGGGHDISQNSVDVVTDKTVKRRVSRQATAPFFSITFSRFSES